MKLRIVVLPLFLLAIAFSCSGQQGPTAPSVVLKWTQSISTGVTANCVYRGTSPGVYKLPAIFCSVLPITTYTDTTVARGQSYNYAVTAQASAIEGAYSNDVSTPIPTAPNAPTGVTPATITLLQRPEMNLTARVIWGGR